VHVLQTISGFANITKPPTKLTEQKQSFRWTSEVEAAFQTLKRALCSAPILAYPQPGQRFIVNTDASNVGIGGALSQVKDGQERVTELQQDAEQGREELLRHPTRTTFHSENTRAFPQVPVWTRVPPAHGPLCVNLAHEF
jgi:hypothetical protein